MITIYRGFAKKIPVTVRQADGEDKGDPVNISSATEIKACITGPNGDQEATLTGTGITVVDAALGKFDIDFDASQLSTANIDIGQSQVDGFIQFPAGTDPIPFQIAVEVEDLPCQP